MIKFSLQNSVELRKRRSKIALVIRLIIFFGVTLLYFILNGVIQSDNDNVSHKLGNHRKLLNVKQYQQNEFIEISGNINVTSIRPPTEAFITERINYIIKKNCTQPAINEFPNDGFTRSQRKNGWITIHVILVCYCFWMMAAVCDDYFVPAIEIFCQNSNIKKDVVGATFMAAAASSPELFINCVGTFVTKGDIGIGTIVGSAVFNILAVPACCGLFSKEIIYLDWWPVSRDCLVYSVAVVGLLGTLYDGKVMWYEALLLVIAYFVYVFAMYSHDYLSRKWITKWRRKTKIRPYREVNEIAPLLTSGLTAKSIVVMDPILEVSEADKRTESEETISSFNSDSNDYYAYSPWNQDNNNSLIFYILRWPITFLFWITIPDCRRHPKLQILTFLLSVCWIGVLSYLVAFFITIIGDTLSIPDSVMGLTILAVGMSIPEAVSSVIVTIQGHGSMGICNSIGSNIFDILLSLGLPWFIKAYWIPMVPNENWITFNSTGLQYTAISLLITLFCLYLTLVVNRFQLDWKIGIACSILYGFFVILATMVELNIFFDVNLPVCDH